MPVVKHVSGAFDFLKQKLIYMYINMRWKLINIFAGTTIVYTVLCNNIIWRRDLMYINLITIGTEPSIRRNARSNILYGARERICCRRGEPGVTGGGGGDRGCTGGENSAHRD